MRIAWFIHRYAPVVGGSENFAREMVRRCVGRGDHVDVFTSDAQDLSYFTHRSGLRIEAPPISDVDGATVHRLMTRHFPGQRYVGKLLSLIPHWPTQCRFGSYLPHLPGLSQVPGRYDLSIGVAYPYTNFSHAAWRLAHRSGCPLVIVPFLHLASRGYTLPHQIKLLRQADLVVAVTQLEANAMIAFGIDSSKIEVLPMAYTAANVTGGERSRLRMQLRIAADAPVIGQVGALDFNKGTEHLIDAVGRLNQGSDSRIHLILAGTPTPSLTRKLAADGTAKSPWLHILGPFADALLPDIYAAMDIYAMPSRTDSFGIVFLEAWANGRPVVAAAAGGVAEVVRDGVDGLLVPFGEVDQLTRRLSQLIDDPAYARQLGEAGRARLASGWTWDDRFEQFAAMLPNPGHQA